MNLKGLADVIVKDAPTMAALLGGPASGRIISALCGLFNVNSGNVDDVISHIAGDPDSEVKLKQLEDQHSEMIANLGAQQITGNIADTQDARHMEDAASMRMLLVVFLMIALIVDSTAIVCIKDHIIRHGLYVADGLFLGQLMQVMRLYFGSEK